LPQFRATAGEQRVWVREGSHADSRLPQSPGVRGLK
jgi:hypothetical protein